MDLVAEGILEDARALFARLDEIPDDDLREVKASRSGWGSGVPGDSRRATHPDR